MVERRVLLVDDDAQERKALARTIEALGYECAAVGDLSAAPPPPYALALIAVEPGQASRLAGLAELRRSQRDLRAIILTAARLTAQQQLRIEASSWGVRDFLSRPVMEDRLKELLQRLVGSATPTFHGRVTQRELGEMYARLGGQTHFERLGLTPPCTPDEVTAAYRSILTRYDADEVDTPDDESRRRLRGIHQALGEAYATLRDPTRRAAYERQLAGAPPPRRTLRRPDRERPAFHPKRGASPSPPRSEAPAPAAQRPPPPKEDEDVWSRRGSKDTPEMLIDAAHLRAVMGDFEGAARLFGTALKLRPDDMDLWYQFELARGRHANQQGEPEKAAKHFQEALKLSPESAAPREELEALGVLTPTRSGGFFSRLLGKKGQ